MQIKELVVRGFEVDYLDLYWSIAPQSGHDVLEYDVYVEKSESEFGPFYTVSPALVDVFHVRDNDVRRSGPAFENNWYRLRVVHRPSGDQYYYPSEGGVRQTAKPDLHALEVARLTRLRLSQGNGRLVWVFPRRTFGSRCSCFDPVTKRRTRTCSSCYDTGFVGGFNTPIKVWANIVEGPTSEATGNMGETGSRTARLSLANYPLIEPGWVVIEGENIRWRVGSTIDRVYLGRSVIKQRAILEEIKPSDMESRLPVNEANPGTLVLNPLGNIINRHAV